MHDAAGWLRCEPGISVCRTLEESDEVGLSGLLQGQDGGSLEAQIVLEILGNLAHQSLEGQLAQQQISRLLVAADLAQSDGSGAVAVRLLDSSGDLGKEHKRSEHMSEHRAATLELEAARAPLSLHRLRMSPARTLPDENLVTNPAVGADLRAALVA